MIQGLLAAVAVILRFAFLFGIYYLIKGLLLLSGRRLPLRGMGDMSKEDWEKWASGEGRVCLYWAESCFLLLPASFFKDDILYSGTCSLRAAGAGVCEESEKINIKYRK